MSLGDFKVLTFDCYGTLIDWETGMIEALKPLTARLSPAPTRNQILEAHAVHESTQQRQTPTKLYSDLLAVVHKRLAEGFGAPAPWSESQTYGASIPSWPAFPDTVAALKALKQRCKLVILSNVDNRSFAASHARLAVTFDAIYTAEDIGSYKPSARNFEYMLEKLAGQGVRKGDILHVAESLYHDHVPAGALGLKTCWIYRRHADQGFGATMDPGQRPKVDYQFTSMAAFAEALTGKKV